MPTPKQPASPNNSRLQAIRESIFSTPLLPRTEMDRKRFMIRNLLLHFRPPTVVESTLRFTLTWGLGGAAVVLVVLQLITGVMLGFVYEPSPVSAYESIQTLVQEVSFGRLIRNMHHWCAHLLVLIVFLHMLRVFFTGAFHPPRQFNWIIGLGLLGIILTANFTGYLLPWDQLAYWAVTVSTGMLDYMPWGGSQLKALLMTGDELGPGTLKLFYAAHTSVVPGVLFILMGFHFWRIRRAGGVIVPMTAETRTEEKPSRVAAMPHLILREVVTALVWIAVAIWLAILLDAPLGDPANPGLSPNPTKAPWYFAGFQEILLHLHPIFAVFVLPLLFGLALVVLPYLSYDFEARGIWFISCRGVRVALAAAALSVGLTVAAVLLSEWVLPVMEGIIGGGVVPFGIGLLVALAFYLTIRKKFGISKDEAVQALFIFAATILVVLTVVNVIFRGPGMALVWLW